MLEYEKIENIKPQNRELLVQDLRDRTGLDIREVEIVQTDFVRDLARVRIFLRINDTIRPVVSGFLYRCFSATGTAAASAWLDPGRC